MPDTKQCCGTCQYGSYGKIDGYVCVNSDSEYVADFTEYNHTCDFWEKKHRKGRSDGNYKDNFINDRCFIHTCND